MLTLSVFYLSAQNSGLYHNPTLFKPLIATLLMKEIYIQFIKDVFSKYHPISEKSLEQLCAVASIYQIKKGDLLLPIGKTSKHLHILYDGVIVSYFLNTDGDIYHKNIFLEGYFVGSMVSALTNSPSKFALEAIKDATLIRFDYSKYRQLIEAHVDLTQFYIAYLEKHWVIEKERREVEIVLNDASLRYLDFIKQYPDIETRVPLHYIASHLGITPTQLSRIRKKLNN